MWLWQLSDPHITVPGRLLWEAIDVNARLLRLLGHLQRHAPPPDFVLLSGDLVTAPEPAAYAFLAGTLAPLTAPRLAIPGNHDDRRQLAAAFPAPGEAVVLEDGRRPQRCVLGAWTLLALDTLVVGQRSGALGATELAWLEDELARAPGPVVIALHHPPRALGLPHMDRMGLADGEALAAVVARHRHRIRALLAGHLHRLAIARFAGIPLLAAPSSAFTCGEEMLAREPVRHFITDPPAALLHHLGDDGELVSFPVIAGPHPGPFGRPMADARGAASR